MAIHKRKQEHHTRCLLKASLDPVFVVYLSQSMSQTGPLAERSSEGMKAGGGKEDDFYRLWEACQQGKLLATGVASVCKGQWQGRLGNSGIPHSMLQCSALYPNVMSHLRSGFNNAAHLQRAGTAVAIKAAHKASAREPTQLLQDLPRQRKANRPVRSGPLVPAV